MNKPEWMIPDKIPIGDFIQEGKGQQWAYRMGYKDAQKKLLEYMHEYLSGELTGDAEGTIESMLKQLEGSNVR